MDHPLVSVRLNKLERGPSVFVERSNLAVVPPCFSGQRIAKRIGELENSLRIVQQAEAFCLELGNKDGLQISYGNQALILQTWGRLEEAMALLKKQEALCLELGNRSGLAYCYWNWGLLVREQGDRGTERQKLDVALDIFTQLNMPRQRNEVRAELEKATAPDLSLR